MCQRDSQWCQKTDVLQHRVAATDGDMVRETTTVGADRLVCPEATHQHSSAHLSERLRALAFEIDQLL